MKATRTSLSPLSTALVLVLALLALHVQAPAAAPSSQWPVIPCETLLSQTSVTVECLNPCPTYCQTAIPQQHPDFPFLTYTYCYCTGDGPAEPRCCHMIRVFYPNGTWGALTRGNCNGNCPAGVCHVTGWNLGDESWSVAKCAVLGW